MDNLSKRPHVCVINCQLEISYLLDSGEISGQCLNADSLKKFGISPTFLLSINGFDLEDCINNVKKKLELLNDK